MPNPLTESLSVSAPTLYFSVSHIPLNMSAMKKRFSLSPSVGRGTFTKVIEPLPSRVLRRLRRRHGRSALRHVHELDLAPLLLEVEVARAAVEVGEEERRDEEPGEAHKDGHALPRRRQVDAPADRLDRVESAFERLEHEDRHARPDRQSTRLNSSH